MAKNNQPYFDISAAVIKQLGEELVTDEVTAIMELVKNSYDADADWVIVEINTTERYTETETFYRDSEVGYIIIRDNGFGMSETDIRDGWMKISLSAKKKFKSEGNTTPKGRTPLGEKGVGRLSTQRLGSRLELFTGKKNENTRNHIAFDWNEFSDETSLSAVPVYFNKEQKPVRESGTTLLITNLKDSNKWTGSSWDRFRGQISQMIFPFKEKRVFNVYLKLNGLSVDLDELHTKVINNSVGRYKFSLSENKLNLTGYVKLSKLSGSNKKDDNVFYENYIESDFGEDFFSFLTDPTLNKKFFLTDIRFSGKRGTFIIFKRSYELDKIDELSYLNSTGNEDAVLAHPGDFHGEIYDFFFKESSAVESAFDSLSEFKRIVQNQVGIRIFRDGFGIKPYGIDGQDWLGLSGGQTSGSSFYGLRPGNVVGYISINARDNQNLREKTDREGFVDNPFSNNFYRLTRFLVEEANDVLESIRRSYSSYKENKRKESAGIEGVEDSFEKLEDAAIRAEEFSRQTQDISEDLVNISHRIRTIAEKSYDTGNQKEDREIKRTLEEAARLLTQTQDLLKGVEGLLSDVKKLNAHVEYLKPLVESLEQQLSDFSELAGLGLTAEALSHELSNIVNRINEETDRVNRKIKSKTEVPIGIVNVYVEYVRTSLRSFRKQLSHLAPSLRYVRESKDLVPVDKLFEELVDYYNDRFKGEIEIKSKIHGANFSIKINKGKLIQVIDNIVLNSEYWLRERKKKERNFHPIIKLQSKEPFIRISDNGHGVDPGVEERVFQPFVTLKPKKIGRGLGLFIVQQLLENSGASVTLLNQRNEFNRRYIFQLNMSNVIE